jgi:hypothetical protein
MAKRGRKPGDNAYRRANQKLIDYSQKDYPEFLIKAAPEAVKVLYNIMIDEKKQDAVRSGAAKKFIDDLLKIVKTLENVDLLEKFKDKSTTPGNQARMNASDEKPKPMLVSLTCDGVDQKNGTEG